MKFAALALICAVALSGCSLLPESFGLGGGLNYNPGTGNIEGEIKVPIEIPVGQPIAPAPTPAPLSVAPPRSYQLEK